MAMPIVLIALGMYVQMFVAGSELTNLKREQWICASAAQDVLEEMRNEDFGDLFRLYNADPLDDPGGPGTAPGSNFAIRALQELADDADGMVGEILLPAWNQGTEVSPDWWVREDQEDERLGTPRDLNGDAMIDDRNHAEDYTILPVQVRLRWQSRKGPREFRVSTILTELR